MDYRKPFIVGSGLVVIELTQRQWTVIDEADLPLVAGRNWSVHRRSDGNGFYARSGQWRMHRLIIGAKDGEIVDHRDGNTLNNRRHNLRIGDRIGNSRNRKAPPNKLMLGVRMINGRFYARINCKDASRGLGGYATEIEAHEAYVREAAQLYGEWAHPSLVEPHR